MPSASRVKRAAVVLHGRPEALGSGLARLEAVAKEEGVELVVVAGDTQATPGDVEVAIVLGGDGTMLRSLQRFLGTGIPVIGVNFGRVGFLSAIPRDELERGVARVPHGTPDVGLRLRRPVAAERKVLRRGKRRPARGMEAGARPWRRARSHPTRSRPQV